MKNEKIAEELYKLRIKNGLNKSEMGRKLGISDTSIHKWESGESFPKMEQLAKLWIIFGQDPRELIKHLISGTNDDIMTGRRIDV